MYYLFTTCIHREMGPYIFNESQKTIPRGRMGDIFHPDLELSNDLIPQIIFTLSPGATYTTGSHTNLAKLPSLNINA